MDEEFEYNVVSQSDGDEKDVWAAHGTADLSVE